MTTENIIMTAAVFLGPVVAVQITRFLDNLKERRERRLAIFKTLMATRGVNLSYNHVECLNRIDLEFNDRNKKDKKVIAAWKAYIDLLSDRSLPVEQWVTRRVDLLVELLHTMADTLDYEFDKTHIKNSAYSPQLYGDIDSFNTELREAVRGVIAGVRDIPVRITNAPQKGN